MSINHPHELSVPMCVIDLSDAARLRFLLITQSYRLLQKCDTNSYQNIIDCVSSNRVGFSYLFRFLFSSLEILTTSYLSRRLLSGAGNIFLPLLMLSLLASSLLLSPEKFV